MEFIGLVKAGTGANYVYVDCCPQVVTLKFKSGPNDNPININAMYTTPGSCAFTILEVGGVAYTNPFSPMIFLGTDSEIDVKVEYCGCLPVGNGETRSIQVQWLDLVTNTAYSQPFVFFFESADITTAVFTTDTNSIFYDCTNDCGRPSVIATFTNPSLFDTTITTTTPGVTPFTFTSNGIPLTFDPIYNYYYFTIPGGGSATVEVSNPGCSVTTATDFTFSYDICAAVAGVIVVEHEFIYCDTCGIDCRGITINTGGPYPNLSVVNNWSGDYVTHTWTANGITSGLQSVTPNGQNTLLITTNNGAGPLEVITLYPNVYIDYSMVANNGDAIDINYAFYSGWQFAYTDCNLSYYAPFTGNYYSIATNIQPGTWYTGTITSVFNYPGLIGSPADGGYFQIDIPHGTNAGDQFVINHASVKVKKKSYTYLLDPLSLNCSDLSLYNQTAIGDDKTIVYSLNYGNGFQNNTRLWFNPWLYSEDGNFQNTYYGGGPITEPSSGWLVTVQSSWIGDGQFHPMTLIANGFENSQKNGEASIRLVSANEFKIQYKFYVIQDAQRWIGQNFMDNRRKLLYASIYEPQELTLQAQSCYNDQRQLASLFYIVDPNINTGPDPLRPIPYECASTKRVFFTNRFWNKGLNGGFSEMSNPQFSFTRNSNAVTDLSLFGDTQVSFRIGHTSNVDSVVFWLFDTSQNNNSIDFYQNYDSSRAWILDIPTPGSVIDNHIVGPSTACASIGGGVFETTAAIGNGLNGSGIYRLGAICYDNTNKIVNSFISDELRVNTTPDISYLCSDLDVTSTWSNYHKNTISTCFSPTIKERVQNQVEFGPGTLTAKLNALGMPPGNTWTDYLSGVIMNIYQKVDNYPNAGQRTYFMWKEYYVAKNNSMPNGWDNPYPDEFSVFNGTGTIITNWFGRPYWDGSAFDTMNVRVGPMDQYLNRINPGFASSTTYIAANNINNDWSDRELLFEYTLVFDLSTLTNNTFLFYLTQINVLHPIAEETTPLPFTSILNDIKIYGVKIGDPEVELTDQVCDTSYDYLIIRVFGTGVTADNFIAMFEPYPYSNSSLYEEDPIAGSFTQLDAPMIYNCSPAFDGTGMAEYQVNMSSLSAGQYKFSGLRIV